MFVDPAHRAEIEMLIPAYSNMRYMTMRCFVWLVRIVFGVLILTLFFGLIAAQLSGTIKHVEMPTSKVK